MVFDKSAAAPSRIGAETCTVRVDDPILRDQRAKSDSNAAQSLLDSFTSECLTMDGSVICLDCGLTETTFKSKHNPVKRKEDDHVGAQ